MGDESGHLDLGSLGGRLVGHLPHLDHGQGDRGRWQRWVGGWRTHCGGYNDASAVSGEVRKYLVFVSSFYLVMPIGSTEVVGGRGWRGRLTTGLTLVTPPMLMLLATPSLRMIWVPGVIGVPGGGADVYTEAGVVVYDGAEPSTRL